ncbi:MAG TPA: VOC family protein [Acidimicrobiia bacterium]|jgi:PhnB protein
MPSIKAIPDGYPQITPYLVVDGASEAIEFYKSVFGFTERMRMPGTEGRVGHAELALGDAMLMLADEYPEMGIRSARSIGGSPVSIVLYVERVDDVVAAALAAGAKEVRPVEDKFYGDRAGQIEDPWGHVWDVMTHIEDVSPEEMGRRMAAMSEQA